MKALSKDALKGQKLSAQGSALGTRIEGKMRPERAKAFLLKQIPLSKTNSFTQGRCPGLNAFAPVGRGLRMTHIPRALPWASRCCPFRAFFPTSRCPLVTLQGVFPDVPLPTCNPGVFPDVPLPWIRGLRGKRGS